MTSYEAMQLAEHAEQVPCPACRAEIRQPCINPHTDQPTRVPHWQRVRPADALDPKGTP